MRRQEFGGHVAQKFVPCSPLGYHTGTTSNSNFKSIFSLWFLISRWYIPQPGGKEHTLWRSGNWYQPLMPPSSLWFWDFSGEWFPFFLCTPQIRVGLISAKLLISPISRHAAKRLDLTGRAWARTESTDLQAKLWIGNVPKPGAACWMVAACWYQERVYVRNSTLPVQQPVGYAAR